MANYRDPLTLDNYTLPSFKPVAQPVTMPPLGGPLPPEPVGTPINMPPLGGPLPPTPAGTPITMPPLPDESGGPIRLGDPLSPYGTPVTMPPLGGPLPPTPVSYPSTGGPLPPTQVRMPPLPGGEDGRVPLDSMSGRDANGRPVAPTLPVGPGNFGPAQTVNDMISSFINGPYAQNAYRRGVEQAAARGLANSSIAGGQAQRAALEAVQPFVSEGMSLLNQREGRALTQQESQLQRDFQRMMQGDAVAQQNWLANQAYSREFNGNLSMIPIANSMQFMQYLFQAGMNDPEVFTPQVLSGYQNFFQQTMLSMLQQFFPSTPGASILPRTP